MSPWIALALAACTAVVDPPELESPEDDFAAAASEAVPEAVAPTRTPAPTTEDDEGRAACMQLVGKAEGSVRSELEALCGATTHDDDCVGFLCERTAPREAFECLLEAGHVQQVIALEHADVPAARAYAREAITRAGEWNDARIREALQDEAIVSECSGCVCMETELSSAGLRQLLVREDRAAAQPLLVEWATVDPPPSDLAEALRLRPSEGWISAPRLRSLAADFTRDPELRTSAAYALARRGDDAGHEVLEAATRHELWWMRDLAVRGLDALDDGDAWDRLAPLLHDDSGHVRISLMRLGARLRPDDAVAALDADELDFGTLAMPELPTRLFAPRAARAVCGHRYADEAERERLVAALERLPPKTRCQALTDAERRCAEPKAPGAVAHALAPALARTCGIDPPPAPAVDEPLELSRCGRTRRKQEAALQRRWVEEERREKVRLLELERRARAAAGHEP